MQANKAAIFGATGLVGRALVRELDDDSSFEEIQIYGRRPFSGSTTQKSINYQIDFARLPEELQFLNATHLFCALGTTKKKAGSREAFWEVDFNYVRKIARLAQMIGVRCFSVVSSMGSDPNSFSFYLRTKGELEQELLKIPFLQLHIFRPSVLIGKRDESRSGETATAKILEMASPLLKAGLARFRPTPAQELAKEMVFQAKKMEPGARIFEREAIGAFLESHP